MVADRQRRPSVPCAGTLHWYDEEKTLNGGYKVLVYADCDAESSLANGEGQLFSPRGAEEDSLPGWHSQDSDLYT